MRWTYNWIACTCL